MKFLLICVVDATGEVLFMKGEPVCPLHSWLKLTHTPKDDIVQWTCPKCGWMATEDYIKNMTPELMVQIKKDNDSLRDWHAGAPARAQAKRIEAQVEGFRREGKEKENEAKEWKEKNKDVKSIMDYT